MSSHSALRLQPEDMQLLSWKFLDGCASADEQQQLAGCLTEHEAARAIYLQCVQLHVDLLTHFGGLPTANILQKATAKASNRANLTHARGQSTAATERAVAVLVAAASSRRV